MKKYISLVTVLILIPLVVHAEIKESTMDNSGKRHLIAQCGDYLREKRSNNTIITDRLIADAMSIVISEVKDTKYYTDEEANLYLVEFTNRYPYPEWLTKIEDHCNQIPTGWLHKIAISQVYSYSSVTRFIENGIKIPHSSEANDGFIPLKKYITDKIVVPIVKK